MIRRLAASHVVTEASDSHAGAPIGAFPFTLSGAASLRPLEEMGDPSRASARLEVEREPGGCHHRTIVGVVASKVVGPHLGGRQRDAGDSHHLECVRQAPAPVSDLRLGCESGDLLQSPANEAIPGRVDCQFVEAACHSTAREELPAHRGEYVDAPANATDNGMPPPVAQTELAALPLLDGVRQDFRDNLSSIVVPPPEGLPEFHRESP